MAASNSAEQRTIELLEDIRSGIRRLIDIAEQRDASTPNDAGIVAKLIAEQFGSPGSTVPR